MTRTMPVCEICGSGVSHVTTVPGYQMPFRFTILDCKSCYTMVADPKRSDADVYNAIYGVPGGPPGYDRNFQYARRITKKRRPLDYLASRQDAFWGVRRGLQQIGAKRVLEVGCGLGYFTYALNKEGYQAIGIDLSDAAILKAQAAYGDFYEHASVESYVAGATEKFDAVVLVEVIEHLERPLDLLSEALLLLKPGGALIATTPNRSYFDSGDCWLTDLPPVHLWWFSEHSIVEMAKRLNCRVEFVDFRPYNSVRPVLHVYRAPQHSVLDADGKVIRREPAAVALARRFGILQDAYWLISTAAAPIVRQRSNRRPTMVVTLSHAE